MGNGSENIEFMGKKGSYSRGNDARIIDNVQFK